MRRHTLDSLLATIANFWSKWTFASAYHSASPTACFPRSKRVNIYLKPDRKVIQSGFDRISVGFQLPGQRQGPTANQAPSNSVGVNVLTIAPSHAPTVPGLGLLTPEGTTVARSISHLRAFLHPSAPVTSSPNSGSGSHSQQRASALLATPRPIPQRKRVKLGPQLLLGSVPADNTVTVE